MNDIKVRIYQDPQSDLLTMVIFEREGVDGRRYYGPKMSQFVRQNERVPEEMLWYLPGGEDTMQLLVDAMAEKGILPKGYVPTRGEVESIQKHLQDMRQIVAHALGTKLKP